MTSNRKQTPKGTAGTGRRARAQNRRRPQGWQWPAWVRPFRRAQRALDACLGLIDSSFRTVVTSERCAHRRPIRTSRDLHHASGRLLEAAGRLRRAARELAESNECIGREPERARFAPQCLLGETQRWIHVAEWLNAVAGDVFTLHETVLSGLETGTFVPEPQTGRRPRIVLAPRPVPVRAFLLLRQPRVLDRIPSILRRRRRTPRPASLRVPRRSVLGRAPPLFPIRAL